MAEAPPLTPTILHVDMDAFFAAVEVLDHPELAGKPVLVGGTGNRGVVAACTYEARAFGVRSAMAMVKARQLCPDAIVLPGNFARYHEVSTQVHAVFAEVTDQIEAIGLDEAFLDVAPAVRRMGDPLEIAQYLRARIATTTGLRASVGIGTTKMVAKLASRQAKPRATATGVEDGPGVVVVPVGTERAFVAPLPVRALWGIGPSTAAKLAGVGITTVAELADIGEAVLIGLLGGGAGRHLSAMANGRDPDPVSGGRPVQSISQESTFPVDLHDAGELAAVLTEHAERVAAQLRSKGMVARTIAIKVRFGDFTTVSRRATQARGLNTGQAIAKVATDLLASVPLRGGVRLLGVGASGLSESADEQLTMFMDDGAVQAIEEEWTPVTTAIDAVRDRFGPTAVGLGRDLDASGLLDRTGRRPDRWGPTAPNPTP